MPDGWPSWAELLLNFRIYPGNIAKRSSFLHLHRRLPVATEASHDEVLALIEGHRLWGLGLGYSDLHLLCSSLIDSIPLWTLDKKLSKIAKRIAGIQGATASLP